MKDSVAKYGGFYIGRYEAGDGDATAKRTVVTPARKVVSKKGAYVYNHVPWGENTVTITPFTKNSVENVAGVVEISRNMYANTDIIKDSVVSHLTYGVEWDAALNFISNTDSTYPINSAGAGWYSGVTGNSEHKTGIDLPNSANKVNNIYDMAGNVWEWTMEAISTYNRVRRGGPFRF